MTVPITLVVKHVLVLLLCGLLFAAAAPEQKRDHKHVDEYSNGNENQHDHDFELMYLPDYGTCPTSTACPCTITNPGCTSPCYTCQTQTSTCICRKRAFFPLFFLFFFFVCFVLFCSCFHCVCRYLLLKLHDAKLP